MPMPDYDVVPVRRHCSTVYVVRVTYDAGNTRQRTRLVTTRNGRARIWFDRNAAEAYAKRQRPPEPEPVPLFSEG